MVILSDGSGDEQSPSFQEQTAGSFLPSLFNSREQEQITNNSKVVGEFCV